MAVETTYVVKRRFKYGGKWYEQGEQFMPTGAKWDKQIIETGHLVSVVNNVTVDPPPAAPKTRRRRRKTA